MSKPAQRFSAKENTLQLLKFALFSASAGVIELLGFTLFGELLHWPYWPAYLLALILSVLYNFTLNRQFTFRSAANVPVAMAKVALFYLVFTPLSTWWGDALTERAGWNDYLVLGGTMVLNFVLEFLYCRLFVYRHQIDTNARAARAKREEDA